MKYLPVGAVLWRAVSYGLPRSLKPENTSNEHGKPENGIINGKGHVQKLGESASVTIVGSPNHCMEGDKGFVLAETIPAK